MSDERRSVRSEIARDLVESLVERIELDPWIPDALRQDYPELTGRLSAVLRRPLAAAPAEAQQPSRAATHFEGCYRDPGHHQCAIRRVEEMEADARDAARWRALLACERIRVLGWARAGEPDMHLGLELWIQHPAYTENAHGSDGPGLLAAFADAAATHQGAPLVPQRATPQPSEEA